MLDLVKVNVIIILSSVFVYIHERVEVLFLESFYRFKVELKVAMMSVMGLFSQFVFQFIKHNTGK